MATGPSSPQRTWRAACPQCGAPVDFASAASPVAVCSFCRSTLARDGDALRRIGVSAELFDDHSPLQLGAAGRHAGVGFTLVGRLQMGSDDGRWNEWSLLFDNGRRGWLSEDNGRHVLGFDAPLPEPAPDARRLVPGGRIALAGQAWQVGAVTRARVVAAEGELPAAPPAGTVLLVELRSAAGEVGTLDYGEAGARTADGAAASAAAPGSGPGPAAAPRPGPGAPGGVGWSVGRAVGLEDLSLTGLREAAEKTLSARSAVCPACGAPLEIRLDTTQTIVCGQCAAVVDVSKGVGGDLAHYRQTGAGHDGGAEPLIPLGATGLLALDGAARPWQVVGYAERCELPDDPDDERVYWREYLLYHRGSGFAFLVDAEDGWSWVVPITGAPTVRGDTAQWQGTTYRRRFDYTALTTHVLGEFYWRVERDQRSRNTDYAAGDRRLNREQTAQELTWSAGATLPAATVAQAFGLKPDRAAAMARDAAPLQSLGAGASASAVVTLIVVIVVLVLLVSMIKACSRDDCDTIAATFGTDSAEYRQCQRSGSSSRTVGGSWGGIGSGGGHK